MTVKLDEKIGRTSISCTYFRYEYRHIKLILLYSIIIYHVHISGMNTGIYKAYIITYSIIIYHVCIPGMIAGIYKTYIIIYMYNIIYSMAYNIM